MGEAAAFFTQLLQKVAQALDDASIDYMVMGGQAVLVYGEPRLTVDVDVTLACEPADLDALLSVCEKALWKILPENPKAFVEQTFVLPVEDIQSNVRLDLILCFTPFEREAIKNSVVHDVGGRGVRYIGLEDLVIQKIFAARPRDLEDARNLVAKNPDLNADYVREWLEEFGAGADHNYVSTFQEMMLQNENKP